MFCLANARSVPRFKRPTTPAAAKRFSSPVTVTQDAVRLLAGVALKCRPRRTRRAQAGRSRDG